MVSSSTPPSQFSTSDTPLAAYLLSQGFNLTDVNYSEPRVAFIFDNSNGRLQEHVRLFLSGKALVEPARYLSNYRMLVGRARGRGE